eukprot:1885238-Pyramimonas_sp.AAC.1
MLFPTSLLLLQLTSETRRATSIVCGAEILLPSFRSHRGAGARPPGSASERLRAPVAPLGGLLRPLSRQRLRGLKIREMLQGCEIPLRRGSRHVP